MRGKIQPVLDQSEHWKTGETLRKLEFINFVSVLYVPPNLRWKKVMLAKSNLLEVRFNPRKVGFTNHLTDSSLLDVFYVDDTTNERMCGGYGAESE